MKKHIIYLLTPGFILLSTMALASCSDDDTAEANDMLVVKSVLPTKIMEGQVVTITGTGLEKATSVVFPGNISVNNITKIGNGYISVITPAGVSTEGGTVTIEADGESAESVMALIVGKPEPLRVAPLDKEIKINECVEVYGNDLEFITKAYFPGEDGKIIVVGANNFKRKATGSLYVYLPMGIKAGTAQVVLEDCSGKKYTLPEVTLSDEVASSSEEYPTLWEGEYTTGWWWYLPASELSLPATTIEAGQTIKFTFTHHDEPQTFCLCDGWWGAPFIRDGGESGNNIVLAAGEDFLEFEISEGMAATMNGGSETALIIGGDITITKIQIKP